MSREQVAYRVEQALLPYEEQDCPECQGKGCEKCLHEGSYVANIDKSLFGYRFIGPKLPPDWK